MTHFCVQYDPAINSGQTPMHCCRGLPNDETSVATEDDSSNAAGYKKFLTSMPKIKSIAFCRKYITPLLY